jgi:hypothetical protein
MSTIRKKALAGMLAGTVAQGAAYDQATQRYTGQRASTDPWLGALMNSGRKFWASRNVQLPDQIALDVADDLRTDDSEHGVVLGRAWSPQQQGEARVALDSELVERTLRTARSRRRSTRDRRAALKELSSVLLHEMGHTGGVAHVEGEQGFMGDGGAGDLVPQETAQAIRRLVKRRPGEKLARGGRGGG